ncbi:MAG TPA: TonB-dependent receptor [Opitutaceae bacterium]|nr:TonB-dependent receptor [Opitutaceae bacterium]
MITASRHRGGSWRNGAILALALSLTALTTQAQAPASTTLPEKKEEAQKLATFEVTGSRIKRIDTETPQPVVRITEAEFKATGFSTLGDAIRAMPAVAGQSLVSTDGGQSFTPGISAFNLRGLGNNNTLVLINGRRAAPYASAGFNGFQTVFDFNSIPTAAIESVEVLKDGASAIYGSDAVAGVVNVNLKKSYTGLSTELSFGNTFGTDSNERSAFVIAGAQAGKLSIVTTFDFQQRASIYGRDLGYASQSDGSSYGGLDQRSTSTPIAGVRGLADRVRFPAGTAQFTTPQTRPTLAAATPGIPLYNFQEDAGFTPDLRSFGAYLRTSYDFNPRLTGFLEVSFRRSEVTIDSAPTPYVTSQEQGDGPAGVGVLPASNPFNPFGQDIIDLRWRMSELGNRVQDTTADSPRIVGGLSGALPFADWTWNGALMYSKNTIDQLVRGATSDRLVQNAFNGITLNGVRKYANPFGPNEPDIINYLKITNPNHDEFDVRSADISAAGTVFTLPAGEVGLAVGAEARTERIENLGTLLNREGQVVGGSQGSDTFGDRRLYSYYAELRLPIAKNLPFVRNLELQLAARHEDYSDFGTTTKPKIAAIYQPFPELLVRGSYGESFLAPNLAFLYTTQSVSFTSATLADPLRPTDPRVQIRQVGGGNPSLQPEETTVKYVGVVLQPFARRHNNLFRELSFGVDYYKFDQDNLINRLTAAQILGNTAFNPLIVRNAPVSGETVGTISHVLTTWQNLSRGEYEGYDFNIRWILPKNEYGQLRLDLSGTYLANQELTAATGTLVDLDGEYSYPQFRGTGTVAWTRGDWSTSIFVHHLGEYLDNFQIARISRQWVVNPQIAYRGFRGTTITVGVRNAFNRPPPLDLSDSKLVNENTNFAEPAFWYFRIGKEF